jgi:hypothetical protein
MLRQLQIYLAQNRQARQGTNSMGVKALTPENSLPYFATGVYARAYERPPRMQGTPLREKKILDFPCIKFKTASRKVRP